MHENGLPVTDFAPIQSLSELEEKIKLFGYHAMLKARRDAYDGRGNFRIENQEQVAHAYKLFKDRQVMLEKAINFQMEVSIIAARNTKGEIATYPPVENIHEENDLIFL